MTERELSEAVRELATMFGWLAYHTHDSRRSEPGFPDWVLVRDCRVIFAELKTEKGRLSRAQEVWMEALWAFSDMSEEHDASVVGSWTEVYVWRPSDLDEIATILR